MNKQRDLLQEPIVSVVLSQRELNNSRWNSSSWQVDGLVVGEGVAEGEGERLLIRVDDATHVFLRPGFRVRLHADEAESYYFNLVADEPLVFVICRASDDDEPVPFLVSASYDEASAYMESEAQVFPVPMPAEIYRLVEEFVLTHYVPEKKTKRRRTTWAAGGDCQ